VVSCERGNYPSVFTKWRGGGGFLSSRGAVTFLGNTALDS